MFPFTVDLFRVSVPGVMLSPWGTDREDAAAFDDPEGQEK